MLILLLAAAVVLLYFWQCVQRPHRYPPGPNWLPFLGNVPELKSLSRSLGGQHLALQELSRRYGTNVLGLKLGGENVVAVFSFPVIRQVLRGDEFESRPNSFFIRLRSMGTTKGITCTDGEFWSIQRNFLVRHLRNLGFGKSTMDVMIRDELEEILAVLAETQGFEMPAVFSPAVLNVLWALTAGARIPRKHPRLQKLLELLGRRSKLFDMSGGILTQFPWLRFVVPERTGYNLIVEFNRELKEFFMETIEEHLGKWKEGNEDDVIFAFITEMKKGKDSTFTIDQLVMICLDIFVAGAETTSNTLSFAILSMILYPSIQEKVQESLDGAFGKGSLPDYTHRNTVPYVEAVLFEVERFCHVAPITGPRRVTSDTVLDNYRIPKNTTILISNYSVHRDPEVWGDPERFRPERFLDANGQIVNNEHLITFNLGKRRCLGEVLARSCIFTFFSGILKTYTVSLHPDSPVPTMKPLPGITLSPQPYKAQFTKR